MRRVAIVGGGIAGLSAAYVLKDLVSHITLIRPKLHVEPHLSSGLWNTAQSLFARGGVRFHHVEHSAYLSREGKILALPPSLVRNPAFGPSLGFAKNAHLIDFLTREVENEIQIIDGPFDVGRQQVEYDLLLLADGAWGGVSRPQSLSSCGYSVFRGVTPYSCDSFQSWGAGLRFAAVPVGPNEMQWYAAVQNRRLRAFDESQSLQPLGAATDGISSSYGGDFRFNGMSFGDRSRLEAPFDNRSYLSDAEELLDLFGDFRIPASFISSATSPIRVVEAVTSPIDPVRDMNGIVHLGDAFNVLDPILAVGATVAVEEALLLRQVFQGALSWQEFRSIRIKRRQRLSLMSQMVNLVSQTPLESARNIAFQMTPHSLKTAVLKKSIEELAGRKFL